MQDIAFSQTATPIFIEQSNLADPVIKYDKNWVLTETYTYQSEGFRLIINAGFEFDLASVPRAFWWAVSPFDLSITAPLIHDFLYLHQGKPPQDTVFPARTFSRLEADRLFDRIMEQENISTWRRAIAYLAVRLFGGFRRPDWEN